MNEGKQNDTLLSQDTEFKREIGVFWGVSIIGGIMIGWYILFGILCTRENGV